MIVSILMSLFYLKTHLSNIRICIYGNLNQQPHTVYITCNKIAMFMIIKTGKKSSMQISYSFFFLISTQSYQGIQFVELVDGVCWGCVSSSFLSPLNHIKSLLMVSAGDASFFFLISIQSYQSIKLVELVDGIKLVELVDGVCRGCVFLFLISTESYQGIKLVELVDGVCRGCVFFFLSPLNHIRVSIDRGHCDCCDRDVWRHLGFFIGHDNNNTRCMEKSEALHWTQQQQYSIHTQDRGHCDCCDRNVWRHLKLYIGHDNNNNTVHTPKIEDIATAVIEMYGDI
ncbi:hypothetical protein LAZ67_2005123 [Cordylochernes scorpioides]|uniref:Uncharacterized protein n=1 Tax=Cordylochernes scorpioides TaxID=51811 RepID=A0ABY6K537_9ARAC|nr:hypothetical protein LAZ67_2005123 [Cordylochernes scorpioides]